MKIKIKENRASNVFFVLAIIFVGTTSFFIKDHWSPFPYVFVGVMVSFIAWYVSMVRIVPGPYRLEKSNEMANLSLSRAKQIAEKRKGRGWRLPTVSELRILRLSPTEQSYWTSEKEGGWPIVVDGCNRNPSRQFSSKKNCLVLVRKVKIG